MRSFPFVQGLSAWCLKNRKYAYKISRCWAKVIRKVKCDQKLVLFYLMNDVVQHSKRKNLTDLLSRCQSAIRESLTHLKKEPKIVDKVQRVLGIWAERQVFEDIYIDELTSLLSGGEGGGGGGSGSASVAVGGGGEAKSASAGEKAAEEIVENFQPGQLCTQLKIMKALEDDTDYRSKTLRESELDLGDMEKLRQNLKDRQHGNDFISDFEEGRKRMEQYIKALEREVGKRRQVVELLQHGTKYYDSLLGEATIVATAYTNFGKRVRVLKNKLKEERLPQLEGGGGAVTAGGGGNIDSISPMPRFVS